jgi:hypothetical protein
MRQVGSATTLAVLASLAAAAALIFVPGHAGLVAHVWLVVVLALALGVPLERLRRAVPSRQSGFDAAFAGVEKKRARPASLARVEREVMLSTGTAFDVHFRLRPLVRDIARGLLLRRGIDLERSPDRARSKLGPEAWALVREDRQPPEDRTAPGLPLAEIERAVASLERI